MSSTPRHPGLTRRRAQHFALKPIASLLCLGQLAALGLVAAQPAGGNVVAGAATFQHAGATFTINQASSKAIINWDSFGSRPGELIRFNQPGANAAVLNRVTGGNMSQLLGDLQANGKVFLINPNGVLVGQGARIDTGGFLASTLDIADSAFLAGGDLLLQGDSIAGVVNLGTISADSGDVLLVARTVDNQGTVQAPQGLAGLAAGSEVLYKALGTDRIFVRSASASQAATGVDHRGVIEAAQAELKAAGGNAYALAVNSGGSVRATGIESRGGRIVLTADGGDVKVSGTLAARNADGAGGEVLVGGDWQGSNAGQVARAANVDVAASAHIDTSGAAGRDGGKVVVWSDGATRLEGSISATGARGGGAEVSGRSLLLAGATDLRGFSGPAGTLLLDPDNITIDNSNAPGSSGSGDTVIGAQNIAGRLATAHVVVQASNSLVMNADAQIEWNAGTRLSLDAFGPLTVNGRIHGAHADSSLVLDTGDILRINGQVGAGAVDLGARFATMGMGSTVSAYGDDVTDANGLLRLAYTGISSVGGGQDFKSGVVNAGTVQVRPFSDARPEANWVPGLDLSNPGNRFDRLDYASAGGEMQSFSLPFKVYSGKSLSVAAAPFTAGSVEITSGGDLTLEAGTQITTGGASVLRAGGQFINQAGRDALETGSQWGRWLVYSQSPFEHNGSTFTPGGLDFDQVRGVPYQNNPLVNADPVGAGNVFYFGIAPAQPLTIQANDATRAYGQANPGFTATYTGLVNGDTASVVTGLKFFTAADVTASVGTYTITPYDGFSAHYDITYLPGVLTVNPADLVVRIADATRFYGGTNPGLSGSVVSGLVNGDSFDVAQLQGGSNATALSGVGSYAIDVPQDQVVGNYRVSHDTSPVLTVTPAPLTVVIDPKTRTYGDANPLLTFSLSGLVNGDSQSSLGLSLATAATASSHVGDYGIDFAGPLANPNYVLSPYDHAELTVVRLQVQVGGSNSFSLYGDAPALGATFRRLNALDSGTYAIGAQQVAPGVTLQAGSAATAQSNVGQYDVLINAGANPNVTWTGLDAGLVHTVQPAPLNAAFYLSMTSGPQDLMNPLVDSMTPVTRDYAPGTALAGQQPAMTVGDPLPEARLQLAGLKNGDTWQDVIDWSYTVPGMTSADRLYTVLLAHTLKNAPGATQSNYVLTGNLASSLDYWLAKRPVVLKLPEVFYVQRHLVRPDYADGAINVIGDMNEDQATHNLLNRIEVHNELSQTYLDYIAGSHTFQGGAVRPAAPAGMLPYVQRTYVDLRNDDPVTLAYIQDHFFWFDEADVMGKILTDLRRLDAAGQPAITRYGGFSFAGDPFYTATPAYAYRPVTVNGQPGWSPGASAIAVMQGQESLQRPSTETLGSLFEIKPPPPVPEPKPGDLQMLFKPNGYAELNLSNGLNAFNMSPISNELLAKALYDFAILNGLPVPRGEISAAMLKAWYLQASASEVTRAQMAGILTGYLVDIVRRESSGQPVSQAEVAFVGEFDGYLRIKQDMERHKNLAQVERALYEYREAKKQDTLDRYIGLANERAGRSGGTLLTLAEYRTGAPQGGSQRLMTFGQPANNGGMPVAGTVGLVAIAATAVGTGVGFGIGSSTGIMSSIFPYAQLSVSVSSSFTAAMAAGGGVALGAIALVIGGLAEIIAEATKVDEHEQFLQGLVDSLRVESSMGVRQMLAQNLKIDANPKSSGVSAAGRGGVKGVTDEGAALVLAYMTARTVGF